MSFAIIQTGGKQYRVSPGSVITVEKLIGQPGAEFVFSQVLATEVDGAHTFGSPFIDGLQVTASIIEHVKGEKIRVFTYKSKKRQRRTMGHRQQRTQVKVLSIGAPAAAAKPAAKRATKATTQDAASE
jgi:large subunit ribosomal protein L21